MDDLQKVFEGWLRSRVAGERPGVAPGAVTEGGYDTDVEGMRSWRADISEFALWLSANEPEMFGEFRYRYMGLDPEGWKAIVGFAGGFHDKPAGPPDESQLESDVEALVDNPVGEDVPAPTVTTPAPTTTTTTTVPPKPKPKPKPPPTTTKPPRTIPVTPDTGPEVTAPPTTTEPPARPYHPSWPMAPRQDPPSPPRFSDRRLPTRPTGPGTGPWNPGHALPGDPGWTGLPPSDGPWRDLTDPPGIPSGLWDHGDPPVDGVDGLWWWPGYTSPERKDERKADPRDRLPDFRGPTRSGSGADPATAYVGGEWPWPGGSAGRAIVTNLELSENGRFLAVVMNDLFDWMNSAPPSLLPGYEQPSGSEGFPTVDENGQWLRPGRQPLVPS